MKIEQVHNQVHNKSWNTVPAFVFKMSMGGLEPPQVTPHAPQTCASTIPPHRHIFLLFKYNVQLCLTWRRLSQAQPSRKTIFNRFSAAECHIDIFFKYNVLTYSSFRSHFRILPTEKSIN